MRHRRWTIVGAVVIALAAGFWAARVGAAPVGTSARVITIEAGQWKYSPGVITVNEGDRVTLRVKTDDVAHGFYLDGYGIQRAIMPGQTAEVHFVATKTGRWMFRCSVTCGPFHPYMIGWLRVEPNTTLHWSWIAVGTVGLAFIYAAWQEARRP